MILDQLDRAGYRRYLTVTEQTDRHVKGTMDLAVLEQLQRDGRFAQGCLHYLHQDVGKDRTDFRSFRGAFGKGSLQLVIDRKTGNAYADIDGWNPYEDVVGQVGHSFVDVLPPWIQAGWRWFRRKSASGR
jgi:hypothetical protein